MRLVADGVGSRDVIGLKLGDAVDDWPNNATAGVPTLTDAVDEGVANLFDVQVTNNTSVAT